MPDLATATEREILEYLKNWRFQTELTGGGAAPILYPDTLHDIPSLKPKLADNEEADASWRKLQSYLEYFDERDWIRGERSKDGYDAISITSRGIDRLEWHKENDAGPRFLRFLRTTVGLIFTSVIIPVVVAILTVVVLSKLGLSG